MHGLLLNLKNSKVDLGYLVYTRVLSHPQSIFCQPIILSSRATYPIDVKTCVSFYLKDVSLIAASIQRDLVIRVTYDKCFHVESLRMD